MPILSPALNRFLLTLVICVILCEYKPVMGRPRSSPSKNALDFFSREARFIKVCHHSKSVGR